MTTFAFSYNPDPTQFKDHQITAFVKNNRHITDWSNPFPGFYFLRSEASSQDLREAFYEFFDGQVSFMVVAMTSEAAAGALPSQIWKWLNPEADQSTQNDSAS